MEKTALYQSVQLVINSYIVVHFSESLKITVIFISGLSVSVLLLKGVIDKRDLLICSYEHAEAQPLRLVAALL